MQRVAHEMATVMLYLVTDWPICFRFNMKMAGGSQGMAKMQKADVGELRPLLREAKTPSKRALTFGLNLSNQ